MTITGSGTGILFIVTVVSSYTANGIPGGTVILTGAGASTFTSITNAAGQASFSFPAGGGGVFQASLTANGYKPLQTQFVITQSGGQAVTMVQTGPCCSVLGGGINPWTEGGIGVAALAFGAFLATRKKL